MAKKKPARIWQAEPEMSNEAVARATGRGWDAWCDLIDAWAGRDRDHAEIAAYLLEHHDVDGWWSQSVTVGYERITGRRLPGQHSDGTFTANKSKTVTVDASNLRAQLLNDDARATLFPTRNTVLLSSPDAKRIRLQVGPGAASIQLRQAERRVKVTVQHRGLPSPNAVDEWKAFWSAWLASLDEH